MATRVPQDAFIDDSEAFCPLCVEDFDLSDKNFKPCPCGYQVCQFCYNNIKGQMNGLCPACRRPYDEQNIEWKVVSAEEQKADIALQARKKAMARRKENEQKSTEASNRKNLAGIRVVQKNLVYVVGLSQKSSEEEFLRTLRGPQYFGQYGKITKIVVSKAKENQNGTTSIGVYVTFESKDDAAKCIAAVDGSQNLERPLRAQYGTTKYCSAFLRNEQCTNRNCTFLHETGEDNDSFSRQDLSMKNAASAQRPPNQASSSRPNEQPPQPQPPPQQAPQNISAAPQPSQSKSAQDEAMSRSDSGDGSALPSSASWATKNTQNESTRSSKPASVVEPSPKNTNVTVASQPTESQQKAAEPEQRIPKPIAASQPTPSANPPPSPKSPDPFTLRMKRVEASSFKYTFDESQYDPEYMEQIKAFPPLFDLYGGLKRYKIERAEELERQKQEEERNVLSAIAPAEEEEEEEAPISGSLQLGGEPETQDAQDNSGRISAQQRSAIQPPFGTSSVFPFSGPTFQASNAANVTRTFTPQQQQNLSILRSQSTRQSPVSNQFQQGYTGNTSLHQHQQSNPFQMQNQTQAFNTAQGHGRQSSRYTFASDSSAPSTLVKPTANPQMMTQQSAMLSNNQAKQFQNQPLQQSSVHGSHFYSGVQGPPPGLKSSGTPPISGGGMFGQGHGFASAMGGSSGFANNIGSKNSNEELMRELLRTRNGSLNGQGSDIGKREFKFPYTSQQPMTSDAPAASLLSSLYGGAHSGFQDHNLQKQKKKGKKHRHANTSSSGGGGIVDLADPSILQARMHHGAAGQGQFGAQGQETSNIPQQPGPAPSLPHRGLAATPTPSRPVVKTPAPVSAPVPPGLSLPQDFPPLATPSAPPPAPTRLQRKVTTTSPIKPAVPVRSSLSTKPTAPGLDLQSAKHHEKDERAQALAEVDATKAGKDAEQVKDELQENKGESKAAAPAIVPDKAEAPVTPSKPTEKKPRPDKIDTKAAKASAKKITGSEDAVAGGTKDKAKGKEKPEEINTAYGSQPTTPGTAVSQTSTTSAIRANQPRTIRIPPFPKAEPSPPAVNASSVSSKQISRRPSITSIHRPGSPASERISDNASFTSTSISRANSPPPARVGSAPVRQVTKNQQKKERQARAKQAEASTSVEEPPPKSDEIQAPIVGRKKKTKKEKTQGTADSTPTVTRPSSPAPKDLPVEEKPAPLPATPVKDNKKGVSRSTTEVKEAEDSSSPATPAPGEQSKPAITASSLFMGLLRGGELSPAAQDLFKGIAGVNHRFDGIEPTLIEDEDTILPDEKLQLLEQGEAIHFEKSPTNHAVILSDRRILQGLPTAEQASRLLELRRKAMINTDIPSPQIFDNLIPAAPPSSSISLTSTTPNSNKRNQHKQKKLINKFDTPLLAHGANGTDQAGAFYSKYGVFGGSSEEAILNKRVVLSAAEAEQACLMRRKETEALEKKLQGLLRKNRRLVFGAGH